MHQLKKKFRFESDFVYTFGLFFTAFILGKLLGAHLGPIAYLVFTIFIFSIIIPSHYLLFRLALSMLLILGLTPFYLIFRGFVSTSPLNGWDLQVYLLNFQIVAYVFNFKKNILKNKLLVFKKNSKFVVMGFSNLIFSLIFIQILKSKSIGHAVAWVGSGDSKNHLVNGVEITQFGFLDPATFWIQPVSAPSFLALFLSQSNYTELTNIEALQSQMLSYVYIWALLIGLAGLAFASLLEISWKKISAKNTFPSAFALLVVCFVPTLSYLLGSALFDGFFTAILGISCLVLLMGWFIEFNEHQNKEFNKLTLGFFVFVISVLSWMFVLPFSLLLFLISLRIYLNKRIKGSKKLDLLFIALIFIVALMIHFSSTGQNFIYRVKVVLNTDGVVNVTNPNLLIAVLALGIVLGITLGSKESNFGKNLLVIIITQIVALFGFKYFSNLGITKWNYYLLKYQWIMFASLSALLLAIGLSKILMNFEQKSKVRLISIFLVFTFGFFVSESIVNSNSNRVWVKIWRGWDNPRAKTMNAVFKQNIDYKNPTMFFHYGYAGESMMANFWLNSFAEPRDPIKGWNYTIDTTGDPKQLCDVNAYYPVVTVVTSDIKLEDSLATICPEQIFKVKLEPPLYP